MRARLLHELDGLRTFAFVFDNKRLDAETGLALISP